MAVNKIPESGLPIRNVSDTDYVRVVGADGKSYRVPKTDFNGGGGGGGTVDPSLSPTSTNAVQNKAIYSALSDLRSDLGDLTDLDTTAKTDIVSAINEVYQSGGSGALTQDTKQALLQCFAHTAWTDDQGQTYYDDLEDALYPFDLLSTISAVYTQSGTVYDTDSLDSLKADLVVTGTYSDGTYNTIRNYTLSGTLTVGTSTVTVTYGNKTATFTVTVTQSAATLTSISAVYTQSGTVYDNDSLDSLKADLVVTALYSDSSTETVPSTDYVLSGTLTSGTSTVTVAYGGKTATFNVTVNATPHVPSTYQEVEYIGFDGNSRIVSDYVTNSSRSESYKIDAVVKVNQVSEEQSIMGLCGHASVESEIGIDSTANSLWLYQHKYLRITDIVGLYDYPAHVELERNATDGEITIKATVNNIEYSKTGAFGFENNMTFVIGSAGTSAQRYSYTGLIYSAAVYEGSSKMCELIPCYRKSDDVIGMYDTVSGTFYTNGGTGTFTKGQDV